MDIIIPKAESKNVARAGADYIRQLIETGGLAPNDQLPSIRELANTNGISTATAQRIYSALEDDGLVVTEQGSGTRVSPSILDDFTEHSATTVFWSYAHKDDKNSNGAISELLKAIEAEYELQTGTTLSVFKDTDSIGWGTNWRDCIEEALLNTAIFIPVLTPTYLKRPACLKELRDVCAFYKDHGIERGIYPIRFVDITRALKNFADDKLAILIGDTQGVNFYEAGTRDPSSRAYADFTSNIVSKIIEIDDELSQQHETGRAAASLDEFDDSEGILDNLAIMEEAFAHQEELLANLSNDINLIEELANRKAAEIRASDKNNRGFAGRLLISKSMAEEMMPLASGLLNHSKDFSHSVQSIDKGVKAYVEICRESNQERSEPFDSSVLRLEGEADKAFEQCRAFIAVLDKTKKISRDLRKPIDIVTRGLELFCSNSDYYHAWADEINSLG